jgi:hypothetical protein
MSHALRSRLAGVALIVLAAALALIVALHPWGQRHNVIIFVADGLRSGIVDDQTAPQMALPKSPVSPSSWPVAMAEALGVVTVG